MELKEALTQRKSVRQFTNESISKEKLESIVKLAQNTPTWVNSQPYKVYIAIGNTLKEIKAHHLEAYQKDEPSNPNWMPMSRDEWEEKPRKNMEELTNLMYSFFENDEFQKASANLFDCQAAVYLALPKKSSYYSIYDLGAFSMSLMLAAKDEGIDSIPAFEFVKYPQYLEKVLDVNKNYQIVMGIGLGYIDKEAHINKKPGMREPLDNLLSIKD